MDPYKVLGVDRNASDADIKKAYRDMVKKYHPDKYADSDLKDLASDKLKEVNAAYAEIQKIRQGGGGSSSYSGGGSSYSSSYSGSPKYTAVRQKIQMNDIAGAESILSGMSDRDAEWYYLMGVIMLRKGWYDGARQNFTQAHSMDPGNQEYAQAYQSINNMGGRGYSDFYARRGQSSTAQNDCPICEICAAAMCFDMCCRC